MHWSITGAKCPMHGIFCDIKLTNIPICHSRILFFTTNCKHSAATDCSKYFWHLYDVTNTSQCHKQLVLIDYSKVIIGPKFLVCVRCHTKTYYTGLQTCITKQNYNRKKYDNLKSQFQSQQ